MLTSPRPTLEQQPEGWEVLLGAIEAVSATGDLATGLATVTPWVWASWVGRLTLARLGARCWPGRAAGGR